MNFKNMQVATKLWLSVAVMVVALISLVIVAGVRTARIQAETEAMQAALSTRVRAASAWAGLTEANAVRTASMIQTYDPGVEEVLEKEIKVTSGRISEIEQTLTSMELSPEEQAQMEKIARLRAAMLAVRKQAFDTKSGGDSERASRIVKETYNPAVATYVDALRELVTVEEELEYAYRQQMNERRGTTMRIIGFFILVFLVVLLAGATWLIRSIRRSLDEANELAARIAGGDLSAHIEVTRGDEFGTLMQSLARMNEALAGMVRQVRRNTDSIATASAQIASGNQDLSARTEQTSGDLQSTASAMDELTSTVQHSADNARQASQLAEHASGVAEQGGAVVREVVSTMSEINASSKRINDIIGVIDGIAFQTNILALNAAVEAARAGEQGRGFAVVAGEVRSLAQRSAEAAKEIKTLIGASVEKVDTGAKLVSQAGETMNEIVQSVRRVTDVIGEITAASVEQSEGIAQVNNAISNLDQMTQQNAALVEESAAAAHSLSEQAAQLTQAVAVFKLGDNEARHAPGARALAAPSTTTAASAEVPLLK